ncbi:hypothetical protein GEMRC1_008789 [Eukaryota sp. GEM-RC1]
MVIERASDPHPRVRWFAVNSLGQLSTDFCPEIQESFHDVAVPVYIKLLSDPSRRVRIHATSSLINFAEEAPRDTIEPYIDALTSAVFPLLDAPMKLGKEQAVTALAALAKSCGAGFVKMYDKLMPYLVTIMMNAMDPDMQTLRGKSIECMSLIAVAVGREKFSPDSEQIIRHLLEISQQLAAAPPVRKQTTHLYSLFFIPYSPMSR